jgi:hypothetical protein
MAQLLLAHMLPSVMGEIMWPPSMGSLSSARELFTRFETGRITIMPSAAGFRISACALPESHLGWCQAVASAVSASGRRYWVMEIGGGGGGVAGRDFSIEGSNAP